MTVDSRRPTPPRHARERRWVRQPSEAAEEFLRSWAREQASEADCATPVRRRLPNRRVLVGAVLLVLAVVSLGSAGFYLLSENISGNVKRVPDVFGAIDPATRPAEGGSLTFLLVGTDTRSEEPTTGSAAAADADPGSANGDALMIARLNADRTVAAVASIPRDSWVEIPGHGAGRINSAYALGGPALLIRTVEKLTQLRVDHFAVIDFAGFRFMVDAVGGIDVDVAVPVRSDGVVLPRGNQHLDGPAALAYVRAHGSPGGGLERAQRQQVALRALVARIADQRMLSSPAGTFELLDAASQAVSVDDTLSNGGLRTIASDLNDLGPADIVFVRAPVAGLGGRGPHPPVYLDTAQAAELWAALRADRTATYATSHPDDTLDAVPR